MRLQQIFWTEIRKVSVTMRWEKNTVVSEVAPFISSPLCPVSFIRIIQLVSSPCSFLCPFPHLPLGLLPLFITGRSLRGLPLNLCHLEQPSLISKLHSFTSFFKSLWKTYLFFFSFALFIYVDFWTTSLDSPI